jgi:hypothetical protein
VKSIHKKDIKVEWELFGKRKRSRGRKRRTREGVNKGEYDQSA